MFEPIVTLSHEKPVPVITTAVEIPEKDIVLQRYIPEISWKNATSHPVSSTVNEIFCKHVLERPDAPAVCAWDGTYTYRELGERSAGVAHELRRRGVKPEVLSALLFEKSKLITVALHAVLQAGGAFVLLDPSLPVGRLQAIFAESKAQMIISSAATAGIAAEISTNSMIMDDEQIPHPSAESSEGLVNHPENALYSVFTSGSTGTPKGFLMEHRALVTCALACGQSLGLNKNSRTLQFSSNSFDLATFEHLIPFIFGACICIPSEEERKGDLTKALNKYQITLAMLTPSVSRLLKPEHLPSLKTVMLCGESVLSVDVRRWSSYVHLYNGYSPAEAGCITIMNEAMNADHPNNIGYSLGITPWVVHPDNHDQLLEVGEVGELIIQGHTVGRGYFGPREKSQSTFIDAPAWVGNLNRESYGSFYKTGDLVQFNNDGSIQFLGRKDFQVKLHGQRLELGEIEHQLQQYFPPPHAMIVELVTAENREPNLIAFVSRSQDMTSVVAHDDIFLVPDEQFVADARRAEGALREKLPAYMVPSDFLLFCHLPMMPSGKTDRRAIRTMATNLVPMERRKYSSMLATSQGQPSTKLEESLVHLWASSLNIPIEQIGTQDNYFSLGGTSLDAIRLSASARKLGYAGLSSAMVFKHPTIQLMAGMLEGALKQPMSNTPSSVSFQLNSAVIDHLLAKCELEANELEGGFLPTTAFQQKSARLKCMHITLNTSGLDHSRLEAAWEAVQKKHISLRSVYITHDGCVYQAFLRQPENTISIQYCDDQPLKEVTASFCDRDTEPVLNGSRWWKLTRIIQERDSSSLLIIRTTHAQFDAMTLNVMFKDFMAAFEGRELSQCELQFPDYMISRIKRNLSSPVMEFWTQFLHGSQMSQPVFTDASSADLLPDHIGMVFVMRPITPTLILPVGITLASVFRAAWAFVLGKYTGQHDLVFGEFVEGRTLPLVQDVESVTGCTAAETPMRIIIPHHEGATIQDLLSHSQAQYATRIPFETCELSDIVPHCVPSWPAETTRFSHLLVLENTEAIPPVIVDGQVCAHNWAFHGRLEDVQVQLVPGKDTLHVAILGPEIRLSQDIANMLVEKLATTLGQFVSMPDALISKIEW